MPEEMLMAVRLAKEGYYPSPGAVLEAPLDEALAAEDHANFMDSYRQTLDELNRPEDK